MPPDLKRLHVDNSASYIKSSAKRCSILWYYTIVSSLQRNKVYNNLLYISCSISFICKIIDNADTPFIAAG